MLDVLTDQVAGLYDPKAKEFYIADWIPADEQRAVMSHELTHALGAPDNNDMTGHYVDSRSAFRSMFLDPASAFSPAATAALKQALGTPPMRDCPPDPQQGARRTTAVRRVAAARIPAHNERLTTREARFPRAHGSCSSIL